AAPPRALRRVQPDLRPRHAVWPQDQRPRGVDPHVAATDGSLGLRRDGHARKPGGRADCAPATDRLARSRELARHPPRSPSDPGRFTCTGREFVRVDVRSLSDPAAMEYAPTSAG